MELLTETQRQDIINFSKNIPSAEEIYKISEEVIASKFLMVIEISKTIISESILPKIQEFAKMGYCNYRFYYTTDINISSREYISKNNLDFKDIYNIIKEILYCCNYEVGELEFYMSDMNFNIIWDVNSNEKF